MISDVGEPHFGLGNRIRIPNLRLESKAELNTSDSGLDSFREQHLHLSWFKQITTNVPSCTAST